MKRWLASATVLVVAGCGGGAGKAAVTSVATVPSPTQPSATTAGASPITSSATAATSGNPLVGAAFCAFLEQDLPVLKSAGSAAGAIAQFAGDFGVWIDAHPAQKPRTASDLDSASDATCPAVRSQAVNALGAASFDEALG
ncbi:MAG: hypothetical protein ACXV8L_15475 [Ilumatobacteraceae bacterium]